MGQSPTLGWIWPKDRRPGEPSRWPRRWRLRDVLTNKGPDIYVGVIGEKKGSQKDWHRWTDDTDDCDTPIPWARRGPSVKYDFRQRKYQIPDRGTWSKVEYCTGERSRGTFWRDEVHVVPRRYWDKDGVEYPANLWHDIVHGAHPNR